MGAEFSTPEDEEVHHICVMATGKLERMREDDLQKRMHRLVDLMPFLWT